MPVTIHTGTSVFPGARSRFGDPMDVDDVAIDFPQLKILLAHGGRPLWMEAAFFLVRRHPNVHLEVSGIPPAKLLEYFPRLEEIADKTIWGTDWPSPGSSRCGRTWTPSGAAAADVTQERNPGRQRGGEYGA